MQSYEMGRTKIVFEERLMTASEVASFLLETCMSLSEFESYMFGSSLYGIGNDYDILIIGPSGEPLSRLKSELKLAGQELPLDILYMVPAEAKETEFVTNEGCITLFNLANSDKIFDSPKLKKY